MEGGAFFIWIAGVGYLALFVTIGTRMGFVHAIKYFCIFIAGVVAVSFLITTINQLRTIFPGWPQMSGLYIVVLFFGGLTLLTALTSFVYRLYNIAAKMLTIFLFVTPLLGFSAGALSAEIGQGTDRVFGWDPIKGVPVRYILLGFGATALFGEWGFAFSRRIAAMPR
jgi:hypothetical protein